MNRMVAKLKGRGIRFRQVFNNEEVYNVPNFDESMEYNDEIKLEENQWFRVDDFTEQEYCLDYLKENLRTIYDSISNDEFKIIDYLFGTMNEEKVIWFLNVTPSRYIKNPLIRLLNNEPVLVGNDSKILELPLEPSAYFDVSSDKLYFKNLSLLTSIFKGIEVLYREATDTEVHEFINSPIVSLGAGYVSDMIKTPNRKRLKAAKEKYESFSQEQKAQLDNYLHDYCPELSKGDDGYVVNCEAELTKLLNGINQRYYTTPIDHERRLANAVSVLRA